jgi:DNA-binding beta-propeller fold protein YncE
MNKSKMGGIKAIGVAIGVAIAVQATPLWAKTIGMVADTLGSVTVFDADTDTVLGTVMIAPGPLHAVGDVLIMPDQTKGFVTNFNSQVFVIDLTTSPPSLAGGTNPIPISNSGEDLSLSPDGKFLVVSDGSNSQPISVIEIATQAEISTLAVGSDTNSVEVCDDGSVLATSTSDNSVRRLTISGTGILTDTGEMLAVAGQPNNAFCAPGGKTGVVITFEDEIRSFTIPGLGLVDARALSGNAGLSGLVNSAGNRVFTRDNGGFVDVFSYNSATAALGAAPVFSIPIEDTSTLYGVDQMALTADGKKLYVSQPKALKVYDASTGALLTSITDPNIVAPSGVFVSGQAQVTVTVDIKPHSLPNTINPRSRGVIPVAILTTPMFDATTVDPVSVRFGPKGAIEAHGRGHIEDIDGDGDLDLVLHFRTQNTGITCGATSASLTGQTFDGQAIAGSDSIKTVGCKNH